MIDTKLKDKVVLVTGANNPYGIGAGIAKAFASEQAKVFLHYYRKRREDAQKNNSEAPSTPGGEFFRFYSRMKPDDVIKAIKKNDGQVIAYECDLSKTESIKNIYDEAEKRLGPVEILVNNAAHWEADSFLLSKETLVNKAVEMWTSAPKTVTPESIDRSFAVNTRAAALMMAEFAERHISRDAKWGRIINISTDGAYCFPSEVSYGASKFALEGYTRSAAKELGQFGITVNIISPGAVQTGWIPPEMEKMISSQYPLRRVGTPEDIADAIIFLASYQARWITGQRIYVGGGHEM